MGSPKESFEQKNIFTEKYDEIRRLDGNQRVSIVVLHRFNPWVHSFGLS